MHQLDARNGGSSAQPTDHKTVAHGRTEETTLPGLVLNLNRDGVGRSVRPTQGLERWGLPPDILDMDVADLFPAASTEAARSCLAAAIETGETQVFRYSLELPGGARHLEAHVAVGDQDDLVLVVHDMTESRNLKDAVLKLLAALYGAQNGPDRPLLAVCAWCNRVRDPQDEWRGVDHLLTELCLASTTHSICPDCTGRETDAYISPSREPI